MAEHTLPSAPVTGATMITGSLKVTFMWQAPEQDGGAPITTYQLILTPAERSPVVVVLSGEQTTYEASELEEGIAIEASVKASNDNGVSYGPELVFSPIIPIQAPSEAPASATASIISPGVVEISWTAPAVEPLGAGYYLVTSESNNAADTIIGLGTADLTQFTCQLAELNPSSTYTFSVVLVNGAGKSPAATTGSIQFA